MISRSIQVPAFQAATTPNGIATTMERMRVTIISERVGSMRCRIIVQTGRLVKIEVPMSPWIMWKNHSPNRTRNGRSRPRLWRMRSTSAGVAWSPAMTAAGSPGAMLEQAEDEQRHHPHDEDGRQDAPD